MIHLIEDYYASIDTNGYTLVKENGVDKDGKTKFLTLGYCGSLAETLRLLQRKSVALRLKDADSSLTQALNMIREQTEKIAEAMEGLEG